MARSRSVWRFGHERHGDAAAAGSLAEQWQDELHRGFQLPFEILTNDKLEAARTRNWFLETDLVIARLDKLSRDEDMQQKLQARDAGWDLVVCDEAQQAVGDVLRQRGQVQLSVTGEGQQRACALVHLRIGNRHADRTGHARRHGGFQVGVLGSRIVEPSHHQRRGEYPGSDNEWMARAGESRNPTGRVVPSRGARPWPPRLKTPSD